MSQIAVTFSGRAPSGVTLYRSAPAAAGYGIPFDQRTLASASSAGLLAGQWWLSPDDDANTDTLDGTGGAAKFYVPNGACLGADGYLYVSEFGYEANAVGHPEKTAGNCIRKINRSTGAVTTFVGLPSQARGLVDGDSSTAKFSGLVALFPTTTGLLVADYLNNAIRFVTYAGVVSTVATGSGGWNGVCMDGAGNIYVAAFLTGSIIKISAGVSSTIATGLALAANLIIGDDGLLYVVQFSTEQISVIDLSDNSVSTLTSSTGPNANGIALGDGVLYFVNAGPGAGADLVRSVNLSNGVVSVVAGTSDNPPTNPATDFHGLSCVAFDGTHLFTGEAWGSRVMVVNP